MLSTVKLVHTVYEPTEKVYDLPPLLMLHGLCGCKESWGQLPKEISQKSGRKVITVDLRNHGVSPRTDDMDLQVMAADLYRLLRDLNLPKVALLGHSMGGRIVLTLALSQPDIVERIIVEDDATVPLVRLVPRQHIFMNMLKNMKFDSSWPSLEHARVVVMEQMSDDIDIMRKKHYATTLARTDGQFHWKMNLDSIDKHLEELFDFGTFNNSVACKALFLAGSKSNRNWDDEAAIIKQYFPNAKVVMFDSGHWIHVERREQHLDTVVKFLAEKCSPTSCI